MFFKEIVGQHAVKEQLIRGVKDSRVSHTIMFNGPEGSGKLSLAVAYSRYLNCLAPSDEDSCGTCRSCLMFNSLAHPDMHFIFPIVKAKSKHKESCSDYLEEWRSIFTTEPYFNIDMWLDRLDAGNRQALIYSSESHALVKTLSKKSYEAKYKCVVIWLPERLQVTAANRLLKLIEEPPEATIIIFVSDNFNEVLPTIRSRTQLLQTTRLTESDIAIELVRRTSFSDEDAKEVARLANGNFRKALSLMEISDVKDRDFAAFQNLMRLSYGRKVLDVLSWAEELSKLPREEIISFLTYCSSMLRESFILNLGDESLNYLDPEQREWSEKFSPFINEKNIISIYSEVNRANQDISRRGNATIVLTHLGLMMTKYIKS